MQRLNRRWLLRRHPIGNVASEDVELVTAPIEEPRLRDGELLVHNLAFLCAPTIRNWMSAPGSSGFPTIALGTPLRGPSAARVIASAHADFPVGCRICVNSNWEDYTVVAVGAGGAAPPRRIPDGRSGIDALGVFGSNALAAYIGLFEVGEPKAGETLLVSGAAGSVGSIACQLGRIAGCRVVAIAGGAAKCRWLLENCGVDACIDYKSESVEERVRALCPNGIDVYFDNVGGELLQIALRHMARGGRIALCGQIASYNDGSGAVMPIDTMRLVYGGIRMQGFLTSLYPSKWPEALERLATWVAAGRIQHRIDLRHGLENLPAVFNDLFSGANEGTLIVQVDAEAALTS